MKQSVGILHGMPPNMHITLLGCKESNILRMRKDIVACRHVFVRKKQFGPRTLGPRNVLGQVDREKIKGSAHENGSSDRSAMRIPTTHGLVEGRPAIN